MGIFEQFPYTNFHDLNLDWILKKILEMDKTLQEVIASNVLSYADPIQWSIASQYPKNCVVVGPDGTAYMSIAPVPEGITLDNTDYWQPIFKFDEQIKNLKKQIAAIDLYDSATATEAIAEGRVFWQNNTLYRAIVDIPNGTAINADNSEPYTIEDLINFYPVYTEDSENVLFSGSVPVTKIITQDHVYDETSETMKIVSTD